MIIATIIICVALLIVFIYGWKKEKNNVQEIENIYSKISSLSNTIENIDVVHPVGNINTIPIIDDKFLRLKILRVLKYSPDDKCWIEFCLENLTTEDITFILKKVTLFSNDVVTEADLTLLFEKVPEYIAPPYGNQYYDTKVYNNFVLDKNAQKAFVFMSRFDVISTNQVVFKESDFIKISIEYNRLNMEVSQFVAFEEKEFVESLKNLKFKNIQLIDENISWVSE